MHHANPRHQHHARQHRSGDAAQRVERQHGAQPGPDPRRIDRQPHRVRKCRAQQHGGHEDDAQRRHGKACAGGGEQVARALQHACIGGGLQGRQPFPEPREFDQRHQPRPDHQQREGAPRVARTVHAPRHQRAAEHQPGEIGGQHHREGKRPRTQELDDGLRPDHFVAQRDAARHGVEPQRQPPLRGDRGGCGGWRRRGNSDSRHPPALPERPGTGQQVQPCRRAGAAEHAEQRNGDEGRQQRAGNRPGGIGGIQPPAMGAKFSGRTDRAQQHGHGAAHGHGRESHQQHGQGPRHDPGAGFQPRERRRRVGQRHCGAQRQHGNRAFQPQVEPPGRGSAVGPSPDGPAAQRQPGEERADANGDGVHIHAEHQRKLLDPQDLIDQPGRAGQDQQRGGHPPGRAGAHRRLGGGARATTLARAHGGFQLPVCRRHFFCGWADCALAICSATLRFTLASAWSIVKLAGNWLGG
ncbi:hypothetical protein D3C87_1081990 [compost metagenome]